MNTGLVILIVVCVWSLVSILTSLVVGDAARARDDLAPVAVVGPAGRRSATTRRAG